MKVRFAGGVSEQGLIRAVDTFFYADTENRQTLKTNDPYGQENVRVAVGTNDEPPIDSTDTITTTFGFDHG